MLNQTALRTQNETASGIDVYVAIDKNLRGHEADPAYLELLGALNPTSAPTMFALKGALDRAGQAPALIRQAGMAGTTRRRGLEAAVRLADGTVARGATHADAAASHALARGWLRESDDIGIGEAYDVFLARTEGQEFEEGFEDATGRFLSREEALDFVRQNEPPLARHAQSYRQGGLLAEDLDDPERGFDPAERIAASAFRAPDGRVESGVAHIVILDRVPEIEETPGGWESGFVTSSGRFVGDDEAMEIARASGLSPGVAQSEDLVPGAAEWRPGQPDPTRREPAEDPASRSAIPD